MQPESVDQIAGRKVAKEQNVPHQIEEILMSPHAAYGGVADFDELVRQKETLARKLWKPRKAKSETVEVAENADDTTTADQPTLSLQLVSPKGGPTSGNLSK
jgi:hypothetical protein